MEAEKDPREMRRPVGVGPVSPKGILYLPVGPRHEDVGLRVVGSGHDVTHAKGCISQNCYLYNVIVATRFLLPHLIPAVLSTVIPVLKIFL
jgi:hypothetical protein